VSGEVYSYSPEEAGPLVGQSANWMEENARAGVIPYSRVGQKIRFTPEHIKQILKQCEVPATAPLKPRASARRKLPAAQAPDLPQLKARQPKSPRKESAA
jgi:hypothetical protein